mmetsp:Transcript_23690/g.50696  ORF Transcript_23690/g.50696 Transcript_23690/m.50696 type:complete len:367 (+) Transcript_23690:85-1185(+)|eukprot:CAMPEP_0172551218 /NCGR_PEP_ID=MMETSP1067-20121228/36759_1 /TAXON_ID=265564 ORGANISM="Thalassiosira punctigera, Strain Tpunct2005C2" /NCGR_SAMPLE_ID=MMETSP1067 /ASSEMBLY_ACC=CAM_ASM_000444 /LENGTH=366 /DNA_ID=CAMNT_0013338977 /DNA_START=78 /DNA_END=1178 /DNA_ORIENTATION=-
MLSQPQLTPTSGGIAIAAQAGAGSASGMLGEREVVRNTGKQAIVSFLESQTCYSVLRASGKVVVFDTRIPIQLAFYALVEHDMQAAPLWDPKRCQFVGILTVTDFIDVLRYYRETGSDVLTLASRSIADILADEGILGTVLKKNPPRRYASANGEDTGEDQHSSFLSVDADANLDRACHLLHDQTMDFLPVMLPSDMRVLATVTYTCVLEHLVSNFREQRRLFDDTIYDLGIGTYGEDVVVAYPHQTLHEVLHTLHLHGLSAVPVIDENTKKIRGVYSRSDITFLTKASDAEDAVSNLNLTLDVLMAQQRTDVTTPDALHTCSTRHTLQYVFEYFAQWKFNRLICVDEEERVVGVVSARDLVAYFL